MRAVLLALLLTLAFAGPAAADFFEGYDCPQLPPETETKAPPAEAGA